MYSTDRQKQLDYTVASLRKMGLFGDCQKTLVVDQNLVTNIPQDFEVVRVPRVNKEFCWSSMWDAGVATACFEKVLYLDSDRLLPSNFLERIAEECCDGSFLFTSKHFTMLEWLSIEDSLRLLDADEMTFANMLVEQTFAGKIVFEPRFMMPNHAPGKNVMSGSTAFTRDTYFGLGGVDRWYRGHGAFADTDFHMAAASGNCKFVDLDLVELHCPHPKRDKGTELDTYTLRRLGLDNYIYYCHKWGVPMVFAETLASEIGVLKPHRYVTEQLGKLTNRE